jgi:hypothetical protein
MALLLCLVTARKKPGKILTFFHFPLDLIIVGFSGWRRCPPDGGRMRRQRNDKVFDSTVAPKESSRPSLLRLEKVAADAAG